MSKVKIEDVFSHPEVQRFLVEDWKTCPPFGPSLGHNRVAQECRAICVSHGIDWREDPHHWDGRIYEFAARHAFYRPDQLGEVGWKWLHEIAKDIDP